MTQRADNKGDEEFPSSAALTLTGAVVRGNTAGSKGGGIRNRFGTVTLDGASSVTGNVPDDCSGTPAC